MKRVIEYIYYRTSLSCYFNSKIISNQASPGILIVSTLLGYFVALSFIYDLQTRDTDWYCPYIALIGTRGGALVSWLFVLILYFIAAGFYLHYHPDKPRIKYRLKNNSITINDATIDKFIGESARQRFWRGLLVLLFYLVGWAGVLCMLLWGHNSPVGIDSVFGFSIV